MRLIAMTFCLVGLLLLSSCSTEREPGEGDRSILKGGQVITEDMSGWVAVPYSAPETKETPELKYAVLSAYNIIPFSADEWVAVHPKFFSTLTGVKTEVVGEAADPRWYLERKGKRIPKEKTGWVALPESYPQIKSSKLHKDREMAQLRMNHLVPKEMHGWVAVDSETLAKLVKAFMEKKN